MTDDLAPAPPLNRFAWLERAADDFPFYNGQPVWISGRQWRFVLLVTLAAFLILVLGGPMLVMVVPSGGLARIVVALLFAGLPLWALSRGGAGPLAVCCSAGSAFATCCGCSVSRRSTWSWC